MFNNTIQFKLVFKQEFCLTFCRYSTEAVDHFKNAKDFNVRIKFTNSTLNT